MQSTDVAARRSTSTRTQLSEISIHDKEQQ